MKIKKIALFYDVQVLLLIDTSILSPLLPSELTQLKN